MTRDTDSQAVVATLLLSAFAVWFISLMTASVRVFLWGGLVVSSLGVLWFIWSEKTLQTKAQ